MTPIVSMLAEQIARSGELRIRDVDRGEESFLYSSGNRGPGYLSIKALVSRTKLFHALVAQLAWRLCEAVPDIDFLAANVTGGVPPGVLLQQQVSLLLGRDVPLVYVRDTRKKGGMKEHVTGLDGILPGQRGVVVEELVNFATTTTNSALLLRELGQRVDHAACIAFYDTEPSKALLREHRVRLTHLLTIDEILQVAATLEEHGRDLFESHVVDSYRDFLVDPTGWMSKRGLTRDESGGTK